MSIEIFRPEQHATDVLRLWDVSLGDKYPISERVFWGHTIGHDAYEPGDGFVAVEQGRVVGFALTHLNRTSLGPPTVGGPAVLMVHPQHRRQGIGGALLDAAGERARAAGARDIIAGGATLWRFWTGIPDDLEGALPLFLRHSYEVRYCMVDLARDLSDFVVPERVLQILRREDVEVRAARRSEVARILAFEQAHFAGWEPAFRMVAALDYDHLIAAWRGDEIVGTLHVTSPQSRFRGANVVWERLLGENAGGIGAVGIAEPHRKRGLGLALIAAASAILRERGVGWCMIDWTNLVEFYGKIGYRVWRSYKTASIVVK